MQLLIWTTIYGAIAVLAQWVSVTATPQPMGEIAGVIAAIFLVLTLLGAAGLGYRATGWWQEQRLIHRPSID